MGDASAGFDLQPAARRLADLLRGVPDDRLDAPTPCERYSVGDLVEHVGGLAVAFTRAATKDLPEGGTSAPAPDAARLEPDWRERYPERLEALWQAWREPAAWRGMTEAGGVALPGDVAAAVALDELVVHGWDLARSTGQPYEVDEPSLAVVHDFVAATAAQPEPSGIFAPPVAVPDDAPLLDRTIALAGRDPSWEARRS